jgi:F420-dependent oxidoreductase-like protein
MRFGLDVAQHQLTWEELLERVRFAEAAGFESAWVFDHFKALYGDPSGPCFEGWSLLAALAAATERIRLGALVTGVTYRHPSILAAQAVTVDHISEGRLDFSLGAAWFGGEHEELGIPFPGRKERIERLEEALVVIKLLWTEDGASFDGKHYRLQEASYRPHPVQDPHPPIWVGASGERKTIPVAARRADVWHTFGAPAELKRKAAVLEREAESAGRDPAHITKATNLSISEPIAEVRVRAEAIREAGFTYAIASWPEQGRDKVVEFLDEVAADLRD